MYGTEAESEGEGLLPAANVTTNRYELHAQMDNNGTVNERLAQRHIMDFGTANKDPEKGLPPHTHHHHHHRPHPSMEPKAKHRRCWNCWGGVNTNKILMAGNRPSLRMLRGRRAGQPRLVDKDGECIIRPNNLRGSFGICLRNWFHLVIEHSWRYIFIFFAGGFVASWFSFGLLYYFIQHRSGDLQSLSEQHQCIANVHSLASAFLFSLESQHTIGYGTRYMTEVCPMAYVTLSLQCIVGVLLQTVLAGIVIAKILRPKKRKQEMRFSQCAVIGPVDDEDQRPALMIRLADIQHRLYIAESHVRLYMATTKINKRGECELIGVQDMNVGYDTGMDRVLLLWPVVIRHIIDQDSPLWEITEEKLKSCQFELIMTVEGIVEATGMAFQARTSFLPDEILWAQRFVPLISLDQRSNQFEVDYDLFDVTEPHPLEPWLPPEEEEEHVEMSEDCPVPTTKLSIISEHMPNGHLSNGIVLPPQAESALMAAPSHQHNPQFRRKSTCSIADSIRSGRFAPSSPLAEEMGADGNGRAVPRKSSRSSLLHVLLRRTQTNDSSPLVSNNNICHGGGGEEGEGGLTEAGGGGLNVCSPLPPLPASPFVCHTLQHSGFT